MGVIFSTINPDDFSTNIKNLNPQFKRLSKKDRNIAKQDRSIAKQARLEEQHRKHLGYLFTHKCSNKNCTETIDFIYEAVTSEKHAKFEAGWGYFVRVKGWLCTECSEIQRIRNLHKYDKKAYFEAKRTYMKLHYPEDADVDTLD